MKMRRFLVYPYSEEVGLAALHKARLKYARILKTQAVPTIDQVGPRGCCSTGA